MKSGGVEKREWQGEGKERHLLLFHMCRAGQGSRRIAGEQRMEQGRMQGEREGRGSRGGNKVREKGREKSVKKRRGGISGRWGRNREREMNRGLEENQRIGFGSPKRDD